MASELAQYLATVIATQQRELERKACKGLTEADHEMFRRGFAKAAEVQKQVDTIRQRNPLRYDSEKKAWYYGDTPKGALTDHKVLPQGRLAGRVKGKRPPKPKHDSSGYVPSDAASAAAEVFARIYPHGPV